MRGLQETGLPHRAATPCGHALFRGFLDALVINVKHLGAVAKIELRTIPTTVTF
jgi:hypothetical protein